MRSWCARSVLNAPVVHAPVLTQGGDIADSVWRLGVVLAEELRRLGPCAVGLAGYDVPSAAVWAEGGGAAVAEGDGPQSETRGAADERQLFGQSGCR